MEYGTWDCPKCQQEHSDPETATITSCGKCGTAILLGEIDENGEMYASEADLNDFSLMSILAAAPRFK